MFFCPSFSKNSPNKIGVGIDVVYGKHTLVQRLDDFHVAIADEPIDAKVDGTKIFVVRVENVGSDNYYNMMVGFTSLQTFDSNKKPVIASDGFTACGFSMLDGNLQFPALFGNRPHSPIRQSQNIIDSEISRKSKEIIVILETRNNGKNKEIRFLCDGNKTKSSDVSEYLKGDLLFPAICLGSEKQQVTTIPIDQIKKRTPEINRLILKLQK